jgi:hypothetical protein
MKIGAIKKFDWSGASSLRADPFHPLVCPLKIVIPARFAALRSFASSVVSGARPRTESSRWAASYADRPCARQRQNVVNKAGNRPHVLHKREAFQQECELFDFLPARLPQQAQARLWVCRAA